MAKPCWVVQKVQPREDYWLMLEFADGTQKRFDARTLLDKPLYQPLKSTGFFMQAHVEGPTVAWNDQIDIAPETLYSRSVPL